MKLTVLMAVNKLDEFLSLSIQSILNQTYRDFVFVILCNGPQKTNVVNYIKANFTDPRISVYELDLEGLAFALNYGINISKTKYIARQDADDISLPERFEKQINFLELQQDYSIVGSRVALIDEKGKLLKDSFKYIQEDKIIKKWLPIHNSLCHPCLMMRREKLIDAKGYIYGYFSEDHDLFLRLARLENSKFHNLDEVLFHYRRHNNQLTSKISSKIFAEISAIHFINLFSRGSLRSIFGIISVLPPVVFLKRFLRKLIRRK